VDKIVLRTFQREVEQQCRFALIAAEDMSQALQEWDGLSDEMEDRFEELVRQEMRSRGQRSTFIVGLEAMLGERTGTLGLGEVERSRFALADVPGKTLLTAT
jgi:hypothetical protein